MKQRCMALLGAAVATLCLLGGLPEVEAATIKINDTKSFSVGAGFRSSFRSVEDAAPSGADRSMDFAVDSMRLYTGGQIHKNIKLTFNTEQDSGNGNAARVLDAIAQLEFSDEFNIWAGRFLPPSDRSNLDGPYYLTTYDFPFVQNYPALFAGRSALCSTACRKHLGSGTGLLHHQHLLRRQRPSLSGARNDAGE